VGMDTLFKDNYWTDSNENLDLKCSGGFLKDQRRAGVSLAWRSLKSGQGQPQRTTSGRLVSLNHASTTVPSTPEGSIDSKCCWWVPGATTNDGRCSDRLGRHLVSGFIDERDWY
jgi:hypothetical protein